LGLQRVEKPQYQRRIKLGHLQGRRLDAHRLFDKGEQETKGVPTTGGEVIVRRENRTLRTPQVLCAGNP
jgi:hypothetical protein